MYQDKEYWENRAKEYIAKHPKEISESIIAHGDLLAGILQQIKFNTVIDGGCGVGDYFRIFAGKKLMGIELSSELAQECKNRYPNVPVRVDSLTNMKRFLKPNQFDLFFCNTVLEHVNDLNIEVVIKQITELFKFAVITEPVGCEKTDEHCFMHDYVALFKKFGWRLYDDLEVASPCHVYTFTKNNILISYSWCDGFAEDMGRMTGMLAKRYDLDAVRLLKQHSKVLIWPPVDYPVRYIFKTLRENNIKCTPYYYFTGTEVRYLEEGKYNIKEYPMTPRVICEYSAMEERLIKLGFKDIHILPNTFRFFDAPMPDEFTVGIYIRNDNICPTDKLHAIISGCPKVKFLIYGLPVDVANFSKVEHPNATYLGGMWSDMKTIMPQVSTLLRLTHTDGLSISVLEYLSAGKQVIWNHKMDECVEYVNCLNEVDHIIMCIQDMKKGYSGDIDEDAKVKTRFEYGLRRFLQRLNKIIDE
ncbi:methyltransferase domain-containing protein [Sulfuricurvum sp.]|uniref:methyltransferase domain-containing protein n=1 Tax=Sulfuricurvum sp. TaxID=2025608 RepID=UPI0035642557